MFKKGLLILLLIFSLLPILPSLAEVKKSTAGSTIDNIFNLIIIGDLARAGREVLSLEKKIGSMSEADRDFVLGYVNYRLGSFENAKEYFKAIKVTTPEVEDYVQYFWGRSCLMIKGYECATEHFQRIVSNYRDSIWYQDAIWGLANAYFGDGKYSNALSTLSQLNPNNYKHISSSEYDLLRAAIFDKTGKKGQAIALLKSVYFRAESIFSLQKAEQELSSISTQEANGLSTFSSKMRLANELLKNQHYDESLGLFEELYGSSANPGNIRILADAYFKARRYGRAKELYAYLSGSKGGLEVSVLLARAAARSDDIPTAIDTYKKILTEYPAANKDPIYIYKLGFLSMDANQYIDAIKYFNELLERPISADMRNEVLWNIGWCLYKTGKYDQAIEYFSKLGGRSRDRSDFWIARCHEKSGSASRAKDLYNSLSNGRPHSYYGFLSAEKLHQSQKVKRSSVSKKVEPFLPTGNGTVDYLARLGLIELATLELQRSQKYYVSESEYPTAYSSIVRYNAKEFGIDENLVYAIIREESRFRPNVISPATAIGLMQIIPSTAQRLAKELNQSSFELGKIFEPSVNIRFGTKYLEDLSELFNGEMIYMIASYNAGEEAVSRWLKNSDAKDLEEFIEEIPYDETNSYVKKVMKSYWIYKGGA